VAVEVDAMEVKKTQQLAADAAKETRDSSVTGTKTRDFLADIKSELSKISWTTPEELRTYTKIVIAATFLFGMGVYFVDLIIQIVLSALESIIRLIGG
jgi:preprotein translocase subunit SecE